MGDAMGESQIYLCHEIQISERGGHRVTTKLTNLQNWTLHADEANFAATWCVLEITHHVANISTAIQAADAQNILNAASARMLRVSYGVM
jgi:hypothetical protein